MVVQPPGTCLLILGLRYFALLASMWIMMKQVLRIETLRTDVGVAVVRVEYGRCGYQISLW